MSSKNFSRRDFLKTGALSTAAFGSGVLGGSANKSQKKSAEGDAKNIIFLVSDGMSAGTMALADLVKQSEVGEKTHWVQLYESDKDYHRGLMDMASLDSIVTDSAAAASSWGCGKRINNGGVNWGPNDENYKPIHEIFRDAGKGTGLVTTTRLTHATPAGFAANVHQRGMENVIAVQYYERGYDLLLGGGESQFSADSRDDGRDLFSEFEQKGYAVVKSKTELKQATLDGKILGTFYDSHLPYSVDHRTLPELQERVPTLAEMTDAALRRLDQHQNGFILQIEGGRVDHAAHGNCPSGLIYDQIAFDDAAKVVMNFTEGRDDTLVILTTDHGNANPGLGGYGPGYRHSPLMLDTIKEYKHSFEWIHDQLGILWSDTNLPDHVTVNRVRELIEYASNTIITEEQAIMAYKSLSGEFKAPFQNRSGKEGVFSGILANYNGIYFISTSHTADYVEIASWGPGSDRIPTFVRNTDLFDLMVDMAAVRDYV